MENYELNQDYLNCCDQSYDSLNPLKGSIRSVFDFWRKMEENDAGKQDKKARYSPKVKQVEIECKNDEIEEVKQIKTEDHINEAPKNPNESLDVEPIIVNIDQVDIACSEDNNSNSVKGDKMDESDINEKKEDIHNIGRKPKLDIPVITVSKIQKGSISAESSPVIKKRKQFAKYKRKTILPNTPGNIISKVRESYLRHSTTVVTGYQEFLTVLDNQQLDQNNNSSSNISDHFDRLSGGSRYFTEIRRDSKGKLKLYDQTHDHKRSSFKKERHSLILIKPNHEEEKNSESRRLLWGLIKRKGHKESKSEPPSPKHYSDERTLIRSRSIATSLKYAPGSSQSFHLHNDKQLFGLPLNNFTFEGKVPIFVPLSCLRLLELNENIQKSNVNRIVKYIIKNPYQLDIIDTNHIVSKEENEIEYHLKFLGIYFRNLQQPLCTIDLHEMFIHANSVSNVNYRLRLLHSLIFSLPELNRKFFEFFSKFLSEYSHGNKRLLKNLCLLYSKYLFRKKTEKDITTSEIQSIDEDDESSESVKSSRSSIKALFKKLPYKILLDMTLDQSIFQLTYNDMTFQLNDRAMKVESGNLNSLVYLLTDEFYNEDDYVNIFFMTYTLFTKPQELLSMLISLYQKDYGDYSWNHRRQLRIIEIIERWFTNYRYFNITDEFLNEFRTIKTTKHQYEWKTLEKILMKNPCDDENFMEEDINEITISDDDIDISKFNPIEVAQAITMVDMKIFKLIESFDLIQSLNNVIPINIDKMISKFNKLSIWVQIEILSCELMEQRISKIIYFSKVLQELLRHHNYNSGLAIYTGLTSTYICKNLPKTWRKGKKKISKILNQANEIFSMDKNFKNYNEKIKTENIAIPIVLILLRNLTSLNELNETKIEENVNFDKMRQIYYKINQFQMYQSSNFDFNVNNQLVNYFQNFETREEEELEILSRNLVRKGEK